MEKQYDTLHELKVIGRGAGTETPFSFIIAEQVRRRTVSDDAPYIMFEKKSGFSLTIIGNGEAQSGFIRLDEFASVRNKSLHASQTLFSYSPKNTTEGKCYTWTFKMGKHKGKSPAEVYLNGESTIEDLKKQMDFLLQNVAKYPANQEGVEAIGDLIARASENRLSTDHVTSTRLPIHSSGTRYFPAADENGYHKAWELDIFADLSAKGKNPYTVRIASSKVRVNPKDNMITEKKEETTRSISLTEAEYDDIIKSMNDFVMCAKICSFNERMKYVESHSYNGKNNQK